MPVILGPDGPSLGGFVCPATVIRAERWKIGQLKAGDRVRFIPVTLATAQDIERAQLESLRTLLPQPVAIAACAELPSPIVGSLSEQDNGVAVTYRCAGDKYLLVEYGPQVLDIDLRFRVHALMLQLQQNKPSRHIRTDPWHPLAAGSLRQPRHRYGGSAGLAATSGKLARR
jgi:urea carboxylase